MHEKYRKQCEHNNPTTIGVSLAGTALLCESCGRTWLLKRKKNKMTPSSDKRSK